MFPKLNVEKAIQAAGVLFRAESTTQLSRLRLLKLLLIADRQSIQATGRPILGSRVVAMDNGPLHSDVYDLIKGKHAGVAPWATFFERHGKQDVRLIKQPDVGLLSKPEIELLSKVVDTHAELDDYQLSQLTHNFAEWKKNYVEGTSRSIPLEDIIDGVGRQDDKDAILGDMRDDEAFAKFFSDAGV